MTVDVVYAQDLALAPYGAIRMNEYYVSQYLDHAPLTHPARGAALAVRQNRPQPALVEVQRQRALRAEQRRPHPPRPESAQVDVRRPPSTSLPGNRFSTMSPCSMRRIEPLAFTCTTSPAGLS